MLPSTFKSLEGFTVCDKDKTDKVYKGIRPFTSEGIAEVLVMPTNQATGTIAYKK